jgi:hypothetical protein
LEYAFDMDARTEIESKERCEKALTVREQVARINERIRSQTHADMDHVLSQSKHDNAQLWKEIKMLNLRINAIMEHHDQEKNDSRVMFEQTIKSHISEIMQQPDLKKNQSGSGIKITRNSGVNYRRNGSGLLISLIHYDH